MTENPNALCRWMLSGPEVARLVNEFEAGMVPDTDRKENSIHHEEQKFPGLVPHRHEISGHSSGGNGKSILKKLAISSFLTPK